MDLQVTEIFASIQGESTRAGRPCAFVRLATCDLRCRWCDTAYAFGTGEAMSIEAIVGSVRETRCPLVVVTGGEPLLQEGTPALLERLLEEGLEVLLETGGHRSIRDVPEGVVCIIDVKCPGSGMADRNHWENLDRLTPADEVKFVIADEDDYAWARAVVRDRSLADQATVLFAPAWGKVDPADLAAWILRDQLPVRLQIQVHKVIWGPDRRGV